MNPEPQTEPRTQRRGWLIWLAVVFGIFLLILMRERPPRGQQVLTQYQFEELVNAGRISRGEVRYDPQNPALNQVAGTYWQMKDDVKTEIPFRATVRLTGSLEEKLFSLPQFQARHENQALMNLLFSLLPVLIIAVLIWFFFVRQIKKVTGSGPSPAELNARAAEQQARFDRILNKWDEQARRMDAVLDTMEREHRVK